MISLFALPLIICLSPEGYDGDTLRCRPDSARRVRLYGVAAPERGEPFDDEATARLNSYIAGGVECRWHSSSWDRPVAICFNGKGEDVGRKLIESGHPFSEWCEYSRGYYGTCK